MAPDVGFEPTTKRLTAAYSTAELIRNKLTQKESGILDFFRYFVKTLEQKISYLQLF